MAGTMRKDCNALIKIISIIANARAVDAFAIAKFSRPILRVLELRTLCGELLFFLLCLLSPIDLKLHTMFDNAIFILK